MARTSHHAGRQRRKALSAILALSIAGGFYVAASSTVSATAASTPKTKSLPIMARTTAYVPHKVGELDCNGYSPAQTSLKRSMICTDIHGNSKINNKYSWNGHFYDNGVYIGHDEPDMTFFSSTPGSGGNVTWKETLGSDPAKNPTVGKAGHGYQHWFELSIAPWFSMALCDGNSYPQLPCTPQSDSNAASGNYPGGGSAFMEMQFYPPGFAPFADSISCDNTHWCAALNIDSLACTDGFTQCNTNCIEPVNFAFIQQNGVPAGPPSPQDATDATFTPNRHTLLMNQGDQLTVHMFDAPVPNTTSDHAFEVKIVDHTTGQTGYMQASAANGFQNTSIVDCSGTPFNFEPEFSTASAANVVPWAALQTNISTEYEIGHFEACRAVTQPSTLTIGGKKDTYWNQCHGPYEDAAPGGDGGNAPEQSDALCYKKGDTHNGLAPPNEVAGCIDNVAQNGDLDFDGNGYYKDWPNHTTPTEWPSSFQQAPPTFPVSGSATQYSQFTFQTDAPFSESTCNSSATNGCVVPPPNAPGNFYPYWTEANNGETCSIEFGAMTNGNTFGKDAQYGSLLGPTFPTLESAPYNNTCPATPSA